MYINNNGIMFVVGILYTNHLKRSVYLDYTFTLLKTNEVVIITSREDLQKFPFTDYTEHVSMFPSFG